MRHPKHSTLWIALQLIRLACQGWTQRPGYTVAATEENGDIYIAVQLTRGR